jgi:hypothetical protein
MNTAHVILGHYPFNEVLQRIKQAFSPRNGICFREDRWSDMHEEMYEIYVTRRGNEEVQQPYVFQAAGQKWGENQGETGRFICLISWAGPDGQLRANESTIEETVAAYCRAWSV